MVPGTMKLSSWDIDSQVGACPRSWHGTSEATFGGFAGECDGVTTVRDKNSQRCVDRGRSVMCAFFTQSPTTYLRRLSSIALPNHGVLWKRTPQL